MLLPLSYFLHSSHEYLSQGNIITVNNLCYKQNRRLKKKVKVQAVKTTELQQRENELSEVLYFGGNVIIPTLFYDQSQKKGQICPNHLNFVVYYNQELCNLTKVQQKIHSDATWPLTFTCIAHACYTFIVSQATAKEI